MFPFKRKGNLKIHLQFSVVLIFEMRQNSPFLYSWNDSFQIIQENIWKVVTLHLASGIEAASMYLSFNYTKIPSKAGQKHTGPIQTLKRSDVGVNCVTWSKIFYVSWDFRGKKKEVLKKLKQQNNCQGSTEMSLEPTQGKLQSLGFHCASAVFLFQLGWTINYILNIHIKVKDWTVFLTPRHSRMLCYLSLLW